MFLTQTSGEIHTVKHPSAAMQNISTLLSFSQIKLNPGMNVSVFPTLT